MDIAPIRQGHNAQWADLLARCFDRKHDDMIALLLWLQELGQIVAWGAWDGDELVAQYTSLLRQLSFNNQTWLAGMSINMAVHPDYRGRGLVKQVSAPVYDEIQAYGAVMGLGFSNAEGVKVDRHSKSYAYQVVGQMQSIVGWLPKGLSDCVELVDSLPTDIFLANESQNPSQIRFMKTAQSFLIRYGRHPFRDYQYGICYENSEIRGIVVYREIDYLGMRGVSLLDAYGYGLDELIQRWGSALSSRRMRFIHTLASPFSAIACALRQSYKTIHLPYSRNPYYLTVRPLGRMKLPVENFNLWDFIGGDIL